MRRDQAPSEEERESSSTMTLVGDAEKADYVAMVEPLALGVERNAWNNHVRLRLDWAFTVRSAGGAVLVDTQRASETSMMVPFEHVPSELVRLQNHALEEMRQLFAVRELER